MNMSTLAGDGTGFLMTGSADKTLKVWDIPSSKGPKKKRAQQALSAEGITRAVSRYTAAAHDKDINAVAVAPNSRILATGSQDRTLKIWSATDGTLQGICRGHKRGIWSVAFSPVDKAVATASGDAAVKIWSVADCKEHIHPPACSYTGFILFHSTAFRGSIAMTGVLVHRYMSQDI